jgi:NAD(P)-dependent dehydrogenase (short-subunit alcohol dehydrogenase family)
VGRFEQQVVIVTGAASGLGRAVAHRVAAEGAAVMGLDVNADGLDSLAAELDAQGTPCATRVTDISDRAECEAAVSDTIAQLGTPTVLCNVAGILHMGHFLDLDQASFDRHIGVNLAGTMWMCQAVLPSMLAADRGSIVNVASNTALMAAPYAAMYGSTKAAVVELTKSLAIEFWKTKVRINCVAPGGIKTPMTRSSGLPEDVDFDLVQPAMGYRGMSNPEEIAAVVVFLASDEAVAVHGAVYSADLGLTAA